MVLLLVHVFEQMWGMPVRVDVATVGSVTIRTVRELGNVAAAAGVRPSSLIRQYELQRAASDSED